MVNVKESRNRTNFLFTSPPILISAAVKAKGKLQEGGYVNIRSLWPNPGLVVFRGLKFGPDADIGQKGMF